MEEENGSKYNNKNKNLSQEELGHVWRVMMKKKIPPEESRSQKNKGRKKVEVKKAPEGSRSIKDVMKLWQEHDKLTKDEGKARNRVNNS